MVLNVDIKQRYLCSDDGHQSSEHYVTDIEGIGDKLRDTIISALKLYKDECCVGVEGKEVDLLLFGLNEMVKKPRTRQNLIVAI